MKVGDIVKTIGDGPRGSSPKDWVGVVLEIVHQITSYPDYRTPTQLRIFFPIQNSVEWVYKQEVRVMNEDR
ncbi:MAG TPA: hypothetical protein EYQ00_05445 [Dehalococcoidia bacterium]|jgi:hypothetical protein|nr:hypothetical protein [Dehalococcoidia bacterium]